MECKSIYFNDLKPVSTATAGTAYRPLNMVLLFLCRYPDIDKLSELNFFDYFFVTKSDKYLHGCLDIYFTIFQINKKKSPSGFVVNLLPEVDALDEVDFEIVPDLDTSSAVKLFYEIEQTSKLSFERQNLNALLTLPDPLLNSIKQHELLDYIYSEIIDKIWVDSDTFKLPYRNTILYIVFIYLAKHINVRYNSTMESFSLWLQQKNISWPDTITNEVSAESSELYFSLIQYSFQLSYHIVRILLGHSQKSTFNISPPEQLYFFFEERSDVRFPDAARTVSDNYIYEDTEVFSEELDQQSTTHNLEEYNSTLKANDPYQLISSEIEDKPVEKIHQIIKPDFNYESRKNEVLDLLKLINDFVPDAPVMSINQAWKQIQDKWEFYVHSFSSRFFVNNEFVKIAILDQLKSLKKSIFQNWYQIKSSAGQRVFVELVSYETFKIEFLSLEAKHMQSSLKEHLKAILSIEIELNSPKFLKNLDIFQKRFDILPIREINNDELKLKANGILDGVYKDLLNTINVHLSNDIYFEELFSEFDKDLEPPNYKILDVLLRISLLNLSAIVDEISLTEAKKLISIFVDPQVEVNSFEHFDRKSYQNQLIKELADSYRSRIDPSKILRLDI
ncbi:TPA: hypothetical protein MW242_001890 [Acinetobacter baumannii]|nr:hypothetical protein [Acinetobacter baumannii]